MGSQGTFLFLLQALFSANGTWLFMKSSRQGTVLSLFLQTGEKRASPCKLCPVLGASVCATDATSVRSTCCFVQFQMLNASSHSFLLTKELFHVHFFASIEDFAMLPLPHRPPIQAMHTSLGGNQRSSAHSLCLPLGPTFLFAVLGYGSHPKVVLGCCCALTPDHTTDSSAMFLAFQYEAGAADILPV